MVKLYALMENWSKVMEAGNTPPVDIFPFLKWVPESLLGMWRSRSQDVGREMTALYSEWVEYVVTRRKESGSRDCFLDRILDQEEKLDIDRHGLYFLCGTVMEGGSDTTSSLIIAFTHAMSKWPEVLPLILLPSQDRRGGWPSLSGGYRGVSVGGGSMHSSDFANRFCNGYPLVVGERNAGPTYRLLGMV